STEAVQDLACLYRKQLIDTSQPQGKANADTTSPAHNRLLSFLLLLPSILLIAVFVYWLIFRNIATSLTHTETRATNRILNPGGLDNYTQPLDDEGYQHALINLLVLTVVFVAGTMVFGLLWAVLCWKQGATAE